MVTIWCNVPVQEAPWGWPTRGGAVIAHDTPPPPPQEGEDFPTLKFKVYLFQFGCYNEMHLIIRLKPDSAYMLDMYTCWVGPSLTV